MSRWIGHQAPRAAVQFLGASFSVVRARHLVRRAHLAATRLVAWLVIAMLLTASAATHAQVNPPPYEESILTHIFPAGGQRGTSVVVELNGGNLGNFPGAKDIVIDGPPGIVVQDVKNKSSRVVEATFVIAPDASPGRRSVRVLNERVGLSSMIYFSVGRLPEALESEPNNEPAAPQVVACPVVVNGRVDPQADVDLYAFDAAAGQKLVAAVLAHAIDSHGQSKNYGFVDTTLQIVDAQGRVIAEAGDTLGLDPQVEFTAPAAGRYTARVAVEAYDGFPQAIYRLVLGELALATSVFPPGGQRGTVVDVELAGPNIPPGTRQQVAVSTDADLPQQFVLPELSNAADLELPFVRGALPEAIEVEPNAAAAQATAIQVSMTANGRINALGDEDWYRLPLAAGQAVKVESIAHQMLRSPIDSLVTVFDAAGKQVAENDDGFALDYVSMHDFRSMDSRLTFTAPTAGDYFIRVSDQSGNFGPRAVYRLSVSPLQPDFSLFLYPDAVPVWGPGSTAAMVVKLNRYDGCDGDIQLSIDGLPPGWTGSSIVCNGPKSTPPRTYPSLYHFLTLTAPADAKPCDQIPLTIVGRTVGGEQVLERTIQPLTLYYSSDTGLFRMTPKARAAVTVPQTPWLSTEVKTITIPQKGNIEIPVQVHNADNLKQIELAINMATSGVATGLGAPTGVPIENGRATISAQLPDHIVPGTYGIVACLRWRGDIRIGMPGPCTPLITLVVTASK